MDRIILAGFVLHFFMLLSGFWMRSWLLFLMLWLLFIGWFGGLFFDPVINAGRMDAFFYVMFFVLANLYFFAFLLGNFFMGKSIFSGWVERKDVEEYLSCKNEKSFELKLYKNLWIVIYTYSPVCVILGAIYGVLS